MTFKYHLRQILGEHIKKNGEQPITNKVLFSMIIKADEKEQQDDDNMMNHEDDYLWR